MQQGNNISPISSSSSFPFSFYGHPGSSSSFSKNGQSENPSSPPLPRPSSTDSLKGRSFSPSFGWYDSEGDPGSSRGSSPIEPAPSPLAYSGFSPYGVAPYLVSHEKNEVFNDLFLQAVAAFNTNPTEISFYAKHVVSGGKIEFPVLKDFIGSESNPVKFEFSLEEVIRKVMDIVKNSLFIPLGTSNFGIVADNALVGLIKICKKIQSINEKERVAFDIDKLIKKMEKARNGLSGEIVEKEASDLDEVEHLQTQFLKEMAKTGVTVPEDSMGLNNSPPEIGRGSRGKAKGKDFEKGVEDDDFDGVESKGSYH